MSHYPFAGAPVSRRQLLKAGAVAGAALAIPHVARAESGKVTAAIGVDLYYATYVMADYKGLFKKRGLDFSYVNFDNGATALDAVMTGSADINSSTLLSMLPRYEKTKSMYATSSIAAAGKLYSVVTKTGTKTVQDLVGKKLGLPVDGIAAYLFRQFATSNNLPQDKIELVNITPPESVAALARGDVDGVLLWEPWPSKVLTLVPDTHRLRNLADDGIYVTNWLYMGQALAGDKSRAGATLDALVEASEFMKANADETISVAAERFKLKPEGARFQYENLDFTMAFDKDKFVKDFDPLSKFALEKGRIKAVPSVEDVVKPEFMAGVHADRAKGW